MLVPRRLRIGRGLGRGFLLYRLGRFATRGPYWHPLVVVGGIAIVAAIVITQTRKNNRP